MPRHLLLAYFGLVAALSLVTFVAYGWDKRRAGQTCVVAVIDVDHRRQHCAVAKIRGDAYGALRVSVHDDDLSRTARRHVGSTGSVDIFPEALRTTALR